MKVGRRGFLGSLLALPFLSRLLPAAPAQVIRPVGDILTFPSPILSMQVVGDQLWIATANHGTWIYDGTEAAQAKSAWAAAEGAGPKWKRGSRFDPADSPRSFATSWWLPS